MGVISGQTILIAFLSCISGFLLFMVFPQRDKVFLGGGGKALAASGTLLLGRPVRWGCDMSTVEARAASARSTSLLPMQTAGFDQRIDMVRWVADVLGFKGSAVELGVKQGGFAEEVLTAWPGVSNYYLVDPWVHQADYADIANVPDSQHNEFMAEALARTARFGTKVHTVRKFSFDAAADFADCSLDFVYVDAVHDYEGALRDILDWWPKLKPGGILSGHDYFDQIHVVGVFGVKSAADRFAAAVDRQVFTTNPADWRSFLIIK
jgi:Methyltransferase domain